MNEFSPKIVCFSCNFGWGFLADRRQLETCVQYWVPVACSGKVDAVYVLEAFQKGADGVLVLGCLEGECHFQDGNYQTRKRVELLKKVMTAHGIEPERVHMVFSADPEGVTLSGLVADLGERIREMGPVRI